MSVTPKERERQRQNRRKYRAKRWRIDFLAGGRCRGRDPLAAGDIGDVNIGSDR